MTERFYHARRSLKLLKTTQSSWQPERDGVDHINIGPHASIATELGKALAHYQSAPFTHPYLGYFRSMEGFWHYVRSGLGDEYLATGVELPGTRILRSRSHDKVRKYGMSLEERRRLYFRDIIMDGNFYKIQQNADIKKLLLDSTLPLANYYLHLNNVPIYPLGTWLVEDLMELREIFKNSEEFTYTPVPKELYSLPVS